MDIESYIIGRKSAGGGGGGADNSVVICPVIREGSSPMTLGMTWQEILEAVKSGKSVIGVQDFSSSDADTGQKWFIYPLVSIYYDSGYYVRFVYSNWEDYPYEIAFYTNTSTGYPAAS